MRQEHFILATLDQGATPYPHQPELVSPSRRSSRATQTAIAADIGIQEWFSAASHTSQDTRNLHLLIIVAHHLRKMVNPDINASQNNVSARLDDLLQRARSVKSSTSIEPPLQVSELTSGNDPLFGEVYGDKDVLSTALESAAKRVFYANIVRLLRQLSYLTNAGRA